MELGGSGGSNGYHRISESGLDMSMGMPTEINHAATAATANNNSVGTEEVESSVREQDRFMPIANVTRLMRKILPPHAKISDDAKETIQECVSEFISFITGEANERCQREQRKTVTAEDILWAMNNLGFDDYIEPLTMYLHRYRELDGGDRGSLRGEPLVRSVVDPGSSSFACVPGYRPDAFHQAHHRGFVGSPPLDGFLQDPSEAGPSQAVVPASRPFPQFKDQAEENL